jgi:predicted RNA-binding Zn-ribbon protein involved in translation (DUF1610 family)
MSRKNDKPENDKPEEPSAAAESVEVIHVESGLRCPACGRDMVPRVRRTRPAKRQREADCTLCGADLLITYQPDGSPLTARRR